MKLRVIFPLIVAMAIMSGSTLFSMGGSFSDPLNNQLIAKSFHHSECGFKNCYTLGYTPKDVFGKTTHEPIVFHYRANQKDMIVFSSKKTKENFIDRFMHARGDLTLTHRHKDGEENSTIHALGTTNLTREGIDSYIKPGKKNDKKKFLFDIQEYLKSLKPASRRSLPLATDEDKGPVLIDSPQEMPSPESNLVVEAVIKLAQQVEDVSLEMVQISQNKSTKGHPEGAAGFKCDCVLCCKIYYMDFREALLHIELTEEGKCYYDNEHIKNTLNNAYKIELHSKNNPMPMISHELFPEEGKISGTKMMHMVANQDYPEIESKNLLIKFLHTVYDGPVYDQNFSVAQECTCVACVRMFYTDKSKNDACLHAKLKENGELEDLHYVSAIREMLNMVSSIEVRNKYSFLSSGSGLPVHDELEKFTHDKLPQLSKEFAIKFLDKLDRASLSEHLHLLGGTLLSSWPQRCK